MTSTRIINLLEFTTTWYENVKTADVSVYDIAKGRENVYPTSQDFVFKPEDLTKWIDPWWSFNILTKAGSSIANQNWYGENPYFSFFLIKPSSTSITTIEGLANQYADVFKPTSS